jgi:TRAP-type C4-dicarboxylate transport system substrate-binding protein
MNQTKGLIVVVLFIFLAMVAMPASHAKEFNLKCVTHTKNPKASRGQQLQFFADEVEKRSGGQVKIKIFWGGGLVTAKEALEATSKGICDIADLVTVYYPDKLPMYQVATVVPFIKQDPVEGVEIARELLRKVPVYYDVLEERYNQKAIYLVGKASYHLLSTMPLSNLQDVKGKKIGGFGRWIPKWLAAAGATPVTVSAGELYTAFEKGTIDGRVFGVATVKQFSLQDVAKNMSMIGFGSWPLLAVLTVNKNVWNSLPPETQKIFLEVGRDAEDLGPRLIKEDEDNLINSFRKGGMQFTQFSPKDREKWRNLPEIKALPDQWANQVEAKGFPGKKIMDIWLDLQEWK